MPTTPGAADTTGTTPDRTAVIHSFWLDETLTHLSALVADPVFEPEQITTWLSEQPPWMPPNVCELAVATAMAYHLQQHPQDPRAAETETWAARRNDLVGHAREQETMTWAEAAALTGYTSASAASSALRRRLGQYPGYAPSGPRRRQWIKPLLGNPNLPSWAQRASQTPSQPLYDRRTLPGQQTDQES